MGENYELKRYNIKPIRKLEVDEVEYIAEVATKKMEAMIPEFSGKNMYEKIKNATIYLADIPDNYTKVNYILSTNSIYIRGEENIKKIDKIMFHEIFHYIQCVKNTAGEGMPERMGLCRFKEYRIKGLALNEAAIQLIISMIFEEEQESNKYFGIEVKSIHNKYFPILCALLQQIIYIVGDIPLVTSLLDNSDNFQIAFEEFAGERAYDFLMSSFDKMMKARDKIIENNRLINEQNLKDSKKKLLDNQTKIYVKEIQNHFFAIQKLCYTEYFNRIFRKTKNAKELNEVKKEIERYYSHIGIINGEDDFMKYIQKKLNKLNKKIK